MQRGNLQLLVKLLRPVMRFCLRNSLRVQEVVEAAKHALIDAAVEEAEQCGRKVNVSSIAVMTGLHRRDVMRIYRDGAEKKEPNLVTRVIGQWQGDPSFATTRGKPRVLSNDEFRRLVFGISQDLHPGTVIRELERLGYVEKTARGLRLAVKTHLIVEDLEEAFSMVDDDCSDLIAAVEENVADAEQVKNLHARTSYDKIPASAVPKVREWLIDEGSKFHQRVRAYLASLDRDAQQTTDDEPVQRVSVTAFSHIQ